MQLFNADCFDIFPQIADKSIDMILCDLPYGTTACKWDTILPFDKLWQAYERIIKDNGAIVLTASQPFTSALVMSNPKMFKFSWVWNKKFAGNFALKRFQPQKIHEDILVFGRKSIKFNAQKTKRDKPIKHGDNSCKHRFLNNFNSKPEYDNKIYEYKEPESIIFFSNRAEKRGFHPTQKPVALMEYLIKTYTNEGELVLDNCMGSGTTGVACKNLNRNFIGIEKDEKYFEIAKNRIEQA